MRPAPKAAYSYRDDAQVPDFDDSFTLLVMDGDCAVCSGSARRIARWDRHDQMRIAPVQSSLGTGLLRHYGFDPKDPQSWLVVDGGVAYGSLDAILRIAPRLHVMLKPLVVLRLVPLPVQDWLYARLARNRYDWFGRSDMCALPDPELRRRIISE
ncbi:MAG: thiol-disulfide oxidoreductase DCC family protein [Pelagimonas sp.]|uniref:thiol-disulfide oxidoreductase DCC family protein n=1 Tax=Pelagimonas sp. TaxID=2073170 RepID=UPI003D6A602F